MVLRKTGSTRHWRWYGAVLVAALTPVTWPGVARAQAQVRLVPQVGLYVPTTELGEIDSVEGAVELAKMESTLGFGLGLEFLPGQTWSFRLNALYGTRSEVPVRGVGCPDCGEARSTVAAVTGTAILRPLPNLIVVQPYLMGGAGVKRYDFDQDAAREEGLSAFVSDQNRLAGQLGAGVEVNAGFATLLFEVSDLVSGFRPGSGDGEGSGKTQHDFFITIGLSLGR